MLFLVYDTETTGLAPNLKSMPRYDTLNIWPYIVQLSYLVYDTDKNTIEHISDSIIKLHESITISEVSTSVHGITKEISQQKGIPILSALNDFIKWVDKCDLIIAHNIEFDRKMIITEIMRLPGETSPQLKKKKSFNDVITNYKKNYCTMMTAKPLCNIKAFTKKDKREYVKFPTLTETCKHLYNFEPRNMHNSLNDIIICTLCFYKLYFDKNIIQDNPNFQELIAPLKP